MPLDAKCNSSVRETDARFEHACELAELAMAVFKADRKAFPEFDIWLFESEMPRELVDARKKAEELVSTVSLDSVTFLSKVRVGYVLLLGGRINAAFGSSMEIEVSVHSENPLSGKERLTTTALVTMVAVDETGRPCPAPTLLLTTEEEERRSEQAGARRRARLAKRPH